MLSLIATSQTNINCYIFNFDASSIWIFFIIGSFVFLQTKANYKKLLKLLIRELIEKIIKQ
jgi:hypothetical protein